jgi:hypothetical protein
MMWLRAARYGALVGWLFRDALVRARWRALAVVTLGIGGTALEIAAIGVALWYANLLAEGGAFERWGVHLEARQSAGLLAAVGGAVLVALGTGAGLNYLSRRRRVRLRRWYETFCSQRALEVLARGDGEWPTGPGLVPTVGTVVAVIRRDARYAGRLMTSLLTSVVPGLRFMLAVAVLLWLDVPLTLAVMAVVGLAGALMYRNNLSGARASREAEEAGQEATQWYRQLVRRAIGVAAPLPAGSRDLASAYERGPIRRFFDAYETRLLATENTHMISGALIAVGVFGVLVALGSRSMRSGSGWQEPVVYLLALRYALIDLRLAALKFTNIARFYPQVERYRRAITAAPTRPPRLTHWVVGGGGRPATGRLEGGLARHELTPGAPVAVVSPVHLNRLGLAWILSNLLGSGRRQLSGHIAGAWFATADCGWVEGASLLAGLGFPEGYGAAELERDVARLGFDRDVLQALPGLLAGPLTGEAWEAAAPPVRLAIGLARGLAEDRECVLLADSDLGRLGRQQAQQLLAGLGNRRILIVFSHDLSGLGRFGEVATAVLGRKGLLGVGDAAWLEQHRALAESLLRQRARGGEGDWDAAEDEDEDEG